MRDGDDGGGDHDYGHAYVRGCVRAHACVHARGCGHGCNPQLIKK